MTRRRERLASPARVRKELDDVRYRASVVRQLAEQLVVAYEEAYDAGLSSTGRGIVMTGGGGFSSGEDSDPTGAIVISPDHRHLRAAVTRVGKDVTRARRALDEALDEIAGAFLDIDPDLRADRAERRRTASGR
jgi:hypothetical protein